MLQITGNVKILPKYLYYFYLNIIPIIGPQICFQDKYNNRNNYVEMNPSLYIIKLCLSQLPLSY